LQGAGLESQHTVEVVTRVGPKLEWSVHSRARVREHSTDLYQLRGGTQIAYEPHQRLEVLAGYIYSEQEEKEAPVWDLSQRLYGGAATPLHEGRTSVELRGVFERFLRAGDDSYSRYRQRLRFEVHKPLEPFVAVEAFVDAHGLQTSRYSGGINLHSGHAVEVQFSYTYDLRKLSEGGRRHLITTRFLLQKPHSEHTTD
jgi:hypothetical protein